MKKVIITTIIALITVLGANAQNASLASTQQVEIKIITSVESIVPAGLGRSRLILPIK